MPWYPGQVAVGQKVFNEPVMLARGFASQPPTVTTPGTVTSGGTVTNSTGFDCMVYAACSGAGGTLSAVSINGGTVTAVGGSVATGTFYLPAGATISITATGTLAWKWLAV